MVELLCISGNPVRYKSDTMIRQRKIELLAPAKNLECGIAAVDHGAGNGVPDTGDRVKR